MSFILTAQRDEDVNAAFQKYESYLLGVRDRFPESARSLATADWYYSPSDHRCPHDAWLESVTISEPYSGERRQVRSTSIRVRLLGAYHDGYIEFFYPKVFRYHLDASDASLGLEDWRYDEFRLSEDGHVLHEIEWWASRNTARWVIEASDVQFQWLPFEAA
jgi:hypothetical protein